MLCDPKVENRCPRRWETAWWGGGKNSIKEKGNLRRCVSTEHNIWSKFGRIQILRLQLLKITGAGKGCPHEMASMWRSKGNLLKLVLSFHHVDSGDGSQEIRFGCRHLPRLSYHGPTILKFQKLILSSGKSKHQVDNQWRKTDLSWVTIQMKFILSVGNCFGLDMEWALRRGQREGGAYAENLSHLGHARPSAPSLLPSYKEVNRPLSPLHVPGMIYYAITGPVWERQGSWTQSSETVSQNNKPFLSFKVPPTILSQYWKADQQLCWSNFWESFKSGLRFYYKILQQHVLNESAWTSPTTMLYIS